MKDCEGLKMMPHEVAGMRLAKRMLAENGLGGWTVMFDPFLDDKDGNLYRAGSGGKYGFASGGPMLLSPQALAHKELRLIILHEITHALMPPESDHGEAFDAVSVSIGGTGTAELYARLGGNQ